MTEAHFKKYSLALNIFQNFEAKNAWGIDSIAIFLVWFKRRKRLRLEQSAVNIHGLVTLYLPLNRCFSKEFSGKNVIEFFMHKYQMEVLQKKKTLLIKVIM